MISDDILKFKFKWPLNVIFLIFLVRLLHFSLINDCRCWISARKSSRSRTKKARKVWMKCIIWIIGFAHYSDDHGCRHRTEDLVSSEYFLLQKLICFVQFSLDRIKIKNLKKKKKKISRVSSKFYWNASRDVCLRNANGVRSAARGQRCSTVRPSLPFMPTHRRKRPRRAQRSRLMAGRISAIFFSKNWFFLETGRIAVSYLQSTVRKNVHLSCSSTRSVV